MLKKIHPHGAGIVRSVALVAFSLFIGSAFAEYARQSVLTIGGYSGTTELTNFPVLVRLSSARIKGFTYDDFQVKESGVPTGADMRFVASDGASVCPHEIDTWNPSGESLVWVKVPRLSGTTTQIFFQYGDATATAADGSLVWKGEAASDPHYAAVWHFGEEIAAADTKTAVSYDSVKYDADCVMDAQLSPYSSAQPEQAVSTDGVLGRARQVQTVRPDGNGQNEFLVQSCDTLDVGSNFTFSAWLRTDLQTSEYMSWRIASRKLEWQTEGGWIMSFCYFTGISAYGSLRTSLTVSGTPSPEDGWIHVASVYEGTNVSIYVNGVFRGSGKIDAVIDNDRPLSLGGRCQANGNASDAFPGVMDETRLLGAPLSADWIKADYDTVNDESFVTAETAMLLRNALVVESATEGGTASPAWGENTGFTDGQVVVCTAPADPFVVSSDLYAQYSSWTLYNLDGTVADSGSGATCSFTYHDGPSHRLVWHYTEIPAFTNAAVFTVSGYRGTGTLTNFPVLVRLSPATVSGFAYADLRADRKDLRFVSMDGQTTYPFEIDEWDESGTSLLWVRIPELSGQETSFRMEYSDAYWAHGDEDAAEVWNGADGGRYAGVWHFGEEIDSAAAPTAVSADSARYDGTDAMDVKLWSSSSSRAAEATSTNAVIGSGRVNQLATESYKNGFETDNCAALNATTNRVTLSLWAKSFVSENGIYPFLICHKDSWNGNSGWLMYYSYNLYVLCALGSGNQGASTAYEENPPYIYDAWTHWTAVIDGTNVTLYANGAFFKKAVTGEATLNNLGLYIGCQKNHDNCFAGAFDETRVLCGAASADWVQAEYDVAANAAFVTASRAAPVNNALVVESSSTENGSVYPTWGVHDGYKDGDEIVCYASPDPVAVSSDLLVACSGWTLYNFNGSVADSGTGRSYTYTYHDGPTKRLVWHYAETPAFAYRSTLTVSGYAGSETLADFPVLVRLSSAAIRDFDYSVLRADHKDLRFTSFDGTVEYPYEIDTWNTNGESLAWVKLPSLSGTQTKFRLEYGDAYWAHGDSPSAVWKGSGADDPYYAGVWHLGETIESASAATAKSADSAKHDASLSMDMTPQQNGNGAQMVSTNGILGTARVNATVYDSQNGLVVQDYDGLGLGGTFTASVWVNGIDTGSWGSIRVFQRKAGWQNTDGWEVSFNSAKSVLLARGADGYKYANASPIPDFMGAWTQFTIVFNGNTARIYVNGTRLDDGNAIAEATDNGKVLMLGSEPGRGNAFPGFFDECRLWSGAASADRAKAAYDTVANASFVTADRAVPVSNALVIESSSGEYGTVTPAYGIHTGYTDGEIVACSAPSGDIAVSEKLHVVCNGWTLYALTDGGEWNAIDTAKTNSYAYEYRDGPTRRLVWNFVEAPALALSSDIGCKFKVNGLSVDGGTTYVAKGATTLEAIEPVGYEFLRWEGDASRHEDSFPVLNFDFEGALAYKAVFIEVESPHTPVTATWQGTDGGSWHDAANWGGALPGPDDTVSLADCGSIVVTAAVPHLASLTVGSGATLVVSNWYSRLSADAITVANGGTVRLVGSMLNDGPTNRVWLAGGTLSVASGGKITATAAGYAGTNGLCWTEDVYRGDWSGELHFTAWGGAYGGAQGFVMGSSIAGNYPYDTYKTAPQPYGDAKYPTDPGSGGAVPVRSGGGAILLDFTGSVSIDGDVTANAFWSQADNNLGDQSTGNGGYGYTNPGFGSGGSVLIRCRTIAGSGRVQADAGYNDGNYRSGGGGGSGGRVAVHYDTTAENASQCDIRFSARGGSAWGATQLHDIDGFGECGTLWLPDNAILKAGVAPDHLSGRIAGPAAEEELDLAYEGDLELISTAFYHPGVRSFSVEGNLSLDTLDNRTDLPGISGVSPFVLSNCAVTVGGNLTVRGTRLQLVRSSLSVGGDLTLRNLRDSLVGGGGELYVLPAETNGEDVCGALVEVAGRTTVAKNGIFWPGISAADGASVLLKSRYLNVDAGGRICANRLGWIKQTGTGHGVIAYGASHGGLGARQTSGTYDSLENPLDPGSGGYVHPGGGVVRLEIARTATIDGQVTADPQPLRTSQASTHYYQDTTIGGSGGTVNIRANRVTGTGTVAARGGGLYDKVPTWHLGDYSVGGGGRVAIWTVHEVASSFTNNVTAAVGNLKEGATFSPDPQPGTVYFGTYPVKAFILFVR